MGGARKPASSIASRAGGGGGKVIDGRGRVSGAGGGGGGARKGPSGGGGGVKKSVSKEKVYSLVSLLNMHVSCTFLGELLHVTLLFGVYWVCVLYD